MKRIPFFAGLAGAALLVACDPDKPQDDAPPPAQVTLTAASATLAANTRIAGHLDGLARTIKVLEKSKLLENLVPKRTIGEEPQPCPPPPPGQPPAPCEEPAQASDFDLSDETDDLKEFLAENVFNEASVESSTATSVTYRLRVESFCPEQEKEGGAKERDPDCVKLFTELPFRITATSPAEGDLDLALSVGTNQPISIQLYAARVGATVDLAAVKASVVAVGNVLEDPVEGFPDRFAGKLNAAVIKNAEDDYTVALSVLETVNVGMHPATDTKYFDAHVAAGNDVLSLRVTASTNTAVAAIDFNAIDVAAALNLVAPAEGEMHCSPGPNPGDPEQCSTTEAPPREGLVEAHLGGINAAGNFAIVEDVVALTGLGLGDDTSTVKFNGVQAIGVDVNAAAGRRFDLTIRDTETGPTITVKPQFAVNVAHDLTAIATAFGEDSSDIPAWLRSGSSSVTFDGAAEPTIKVIEGTDPDGDEGPQERSSDKVQVSAGKLTLDGSAIDPIVIDAPSCIVEASGEHSDDEHIFRSIASGACE